MRALDIVRLLDYAPRTGALTWCETGHSAITASPYGPRVQYGKQLYSAVNMIWLITHGRIPPRVTFLNGDRYDLRMSNMRYLSTDEYRARNRAIKQEASRAASRSRTALPQGVIQCRKTGLFYSRVLIAGRIEETKRVSDPREAKLLRRALMSRA